MEKLDKFIDWICGKTDEFPFFQEKEMPDVPFPDGYQQLDEKKK